MTAIAESHLPHFLYGVTHLDHVGSAQAHLCGNHQLGLGHTSEKTTRFYLAQLDQSELNRANAIITGSLDMIVAGIKKPYLRNKGVVRLWMIWMS